MGATVFPKPLDHEVDENAQAESSTSLIVARHNLNLGAFTSANFYALVTDIFAAINTSYPLADLALGSIVTGSLVWTNNDSFYYVYTSTSGYGTLQISSTWLIGEAAVNKSTLALVAFNFHNSSSLAINAISNSAPKAISKGQYINWNGALRKAKAAIASGESLSSSNLEDVADGGLNDLNSKIAEIAGHGLVYGVSSLSELETGISNIVSNMIDGSAAHYGFVCDAAFDIFPNGGVYSGFVHKINANVYQFDGISVSGEDVSVVYNWGTWTVKSLSSNVNLKADGRLLIADASTGDFNVTKTGRYVPVLFYGIHGNAAFCVLSVSDTNFTDIVGNKSSYFSGSGTTITIAHGTGGNAIYAVGSII